MAGYARVVLATSHLLSVSSPAQTGQGRIMPVASPDPQVLAKAPRMVVKATLVLLVMLKAPGATGAVAPGATGTVVEDPRCYGCC